MFRFLSFLLALSIASPVALAQGFLLIHGSSEPIRLPRPVLPHWPHHPPHIRPLPPPASYQISELSVHARLVDQGAQVQVSQTFVNTGGRTLEASFVFPLPYDGAVEQMTFMVDGKEYAARLLKADEARRIYEETVRRNRDPALLEWIGTGMFRTSVFPIPPGAKRTVTLRYSQLLRASDGASDFLFPLSTAKYTSKPLEKLEIRVSLESQQPLKNLYSPTHAIEIKRPDDRHAVVTFSKTGEVPSSDFRLIFDAGRGKLGARVLSYRPKTNEDGYFMLLATPELQSADRKPPAAKTVLFVIDRSGSMSGKKIEQVRAALKFVLNDLQKDDLFNIVAYDDRIELFRPELQRYTDTTRREALGFVEGLFAGGSTNIAAALQAALGQLRDSRRPSYVLFLTDGLPTAGETNEMKIAALARQSNQVRARLFSFGVGYDVNSRLLEKLSRDNFGQVEYVRPEEDIEGRISRLYQRVRAPVLSSVKISVTMEGAKPEHGPIFSRTYPRDEFDVFAGEQLVAVGRYRRAGQARVTLRGTVAGQTHEIVVPARLAEKSPDDRLGFVEKLWAMRRVGEILEDIDLKGRNEELVKELVELATRHGILTPYTSFLADENAPREVTLQMREATRRLSALHDASGAGGFEQRAMRSQLQAAAPSGPAGGFRFGGRGSGAGMVAGTAPAVPALTYAWAQQSEKEQISAQHTVRQVGQRAFYRREGRWVDATLNASQLAAPKRVKQFSDEQFALIAKHGREAAQYFTFDEPVIVNLAGEAYLIEP